MTVVSDLSVTALDIVRSDFPKFLRILGSVTIAETLRRIENSFPVVTIGKAEVKEIVRMVISVWVTTCKLNVKLTLQ